MRRVSLPGDGEAGLQTQVSHSGCSCVSDENWDEDQLLGFEPCKENLVSGCNIIGGRCECDAVRACSSPFEFPRKDACLAALKRIEGKWRAPGSRGATHTGCGGHALSMSGCWCVGVCGCSCLGIHTQVRPGEPGSRGHVCREDGSLGHSPGADCCGQPWGVPLGQ